MSSSIGNRIFIDGLRSREQLAGAIAGALRDIERSAEKRGERVLWGDVSFSTEEDLIDDRSITGGIAIHRNRSLRIEALTIDPREVADA